MNFWKTEQNGKEIQIETPSIENKSTKQSERIFCEQIGLDIKNPKTIKCIDEQDSKSFNKWVLMFIKRRKICIKLMWKGLVDQQMCFGFKLTSDWLHGTDGIFCHKKLFDCKKERGVLIPFSEDMECCESRGMHHKSLIENEIISEDLICCLEHIDKSELMHLQINETSIFGKTITNKNISWIGKINEQECIGIHFNKIDVNKYRIGNWVDKLQICSKDLDKFALIRIGDHHIDLVDKIFVSNQNNINTWKIETRCGIFNIGQLVEVKRFCGKVAFFVERFHLIGLILDDHQIHELHRFFKNILFKESIFPHHNQGIIVKEESVQEFSGELYFLNDSCLIDPRSIKYRSQSQSEEFHKNDIVQPIHHESHMYYKIKNFWLLNGQKCLEIVKAISLEEKNKSDFLREENARKIEKFQTKYYLETIIEPSSIVTLEKLNMDSLKPNDEVEFKSRVSDALFQGTVKMIAKVNEMPSAIVQLKCDVPHISCQIKNNEMMSAIFNKLEENCIVVPIDLLKTLDGKLELVEGIWMRCSTEVTSSRGQIQDKYIIFQCNGKQCSALLKWMGAINNDGIFLGCEIEKPITFGTNGTFGKKQLFRCKDGCGVLIPEDKLNFCCLNDGHKGLKISNNRIDEKTICCIKPMEKSSLNTKIIVNETLRKINGPITGIFKWVGLVNGKEVIGLDSNKIQNGTDGTFCGIKLFNCNRSCGALFESEYFECEYQLVCDIGIKIIDPFHVKNIENGSPITKQMYLNPKVNKQPFNVRWAGCIDGKLCFGCVLNNDFEYGTDGTFAGQKLFECADKRGVLIADDELRDGCNFENHKEISKIGRIRGILREINKNIDPTSICCAQWLKDIKFIKSLRIDSRIKINNQPNFTGSCKWLGLINGKDAVGVEMDDFCGGTNGRFALLDLFTCKNGRGFLFMVEDIIHDVDSEKPHFIVDQIIDINKVFPVKPLNNQMEAKQFLRKSAIIKIENGEYVGEIKWIGLINTVKCVGLDMENHFDYGMDGKINDEFRFECMKGHGLMTPMTNVKLSDIAPNFIDDFVINPHKYLEFKEDWNKEFLKERNVNKNGFVFVKFRKEDTETELKGKLRWCGWMNKVSIAAVELVEDHEYGTNGLFWRQKLFTCSDKRAIAVPWNCIYQYLPYKKMDIPIEERIFPQIDINFAVKSYINDVQNELLLKEVCGRVKWTGIDENGQYMYGVESDDIVENGTDGQFEGQRLFNCKLGHGLLFPMDKVIMDPRFTGEKIELFDQYFFILFMKSDNVELEIKIIKNILKLSTDCKYNLMKSIFEHKDGPLNLDVHQYLLPALIEDKNVPLIKLLLTNCDLTPVSNGTFLNLAALAMKVRDDQLFQAAVENCRDKNELLENGESFLTNLFKEKYSEERIHKIISEDIFNAKIKSKNSESPFILACEMGMLSIVEKIAPKILSSVEKKNAIKIVSTCISNRCKNNEPIDNILTILSIINDIGEEQECNICMENVINMVLDCGHVLCEDCVAKMYQCPICRVDIKNTRKLYF